MTLIQRIEGAAEGSRELDVAIALAVEPAFAGWIEHPANNGNQFGELAPSREAFDEWLIHNGPPCLVSVRAYTTSIDAAMSLVPDGTFPKVERLATAWLASVRSHHWADERSVEFDAYAATPALALCAASLKARGVME